MPPSPSDDARAQLPSVLCDEEYPPLDGAFQNRTYGRRLGLEDVRSFWRETLGLIKAGRAPSDAGLYVHWPFCETRCAYCYCDSRVAGTEDTAPYLAGLLKEIDSFSDLFKDTALTSMILAGGTPTQASSDQLDRLLAYIDANFSFSAGSDKGVEATAASLTSEKIGVLKSHGVNRIDLGVDTLDLEAQGLAGRARQSAADVAEACRRVRDAGMRLEIGVLFGIEGQDAAGFLRDLKTLLEENPDRVRIYGFDPRPQTKFREEGKKMSPDRLREISVVLAASEELAGRSGYRPSAQMWRVPASYLGIGASAKSRCFGAGWYQHPILGRFAAVHDDIPAFYGMRMDLTEEKRGCFIGSLSTLGALSRSSYRSLFGDDAAGSGPLKETLEALAAEGHVSVSDDEIKMTHAQRAQRSLALRRFYGQGVLVELKASARRGGNGSPPAEGFRNLCRVFEREGGRA